MSKVVNLRQARKQRDRAARKTQADANAAKHGRTKVEREGEATQRDMNERHLDGHKRDGD